MIRARTVVAFVLGWALARWSVFRMDIDKYHTIRMDFEETMEKLRQELDRMEDHRYD